MIVVDSRGQTLSLAGTIYDDLEVGIRVYSFGPGGARLSLNDVPVNAGANPKIMPNAAEASKPEP